MPLDVQILEASDYGRLEKLVTESPHGSVFSTPSWANYLAFPHECLGVFKGAEMVGGGVIPLSDGRVSRHIDATPWVGIVGRSEDESECGEIARGVAENLLARYPETTLTLPPEWTDIRPFTWLGMRAHVRYTYRGFGKSGYERRLKFGPSIAEHTIFVSGDHPTWDKHEFRIGDSVVTTLHDWKHAYYWSANKGGRFHAECVNAMIGVAERDGLGFDMVGCNSPQRGLFKRAFGGQLTPYFAVTTSDVLDLREPDARFAPLREVPVGTETAFSAGMSAL